MTNEPKLGWKGVVDCTGVGGRGLSVIRAELALKVCSAMEILEQVIGYGVKGE